MTFHLKSIGTKWQALITCVLAVLAVPIAPSRSWADEPQPAANESVDDELLKQLDDSLGDKPAEKPAGDQERGSGKTQPKRPPAPSTDEDLLKELDAKDDPGVGPTKDKPGEDLGENADPLTKIGAKMRHAVTLIDREKLSEQTTKLQDEIVDDIDKLIKQQKKKMQQQQQQSSSQSQSRSQQSSRSSVKPQGSQSQQQRGGTGEQQNNQRPQESTDRLGRDQQKPPRLDPAAQEELLKRIWGSLPEKDREQMRQAAGEEFLPEYESLIIRYFRRLAEEETKE
jgi:hypothetical protein